MHVEEDVQAPCTGQIYHLFQFVQICFIVLLCLDEITKTTTIIIIIIMIIKIIIIINKERERERFLHKKIV